MLRKVELDRNEDDRVVMPGADLSGADLYRADLYRADLYRADLYRADLRKANLRGADLQWADLGGADLRGADLRGAHLRCAILFSADLRGADLRGADLEEAIGIDEVPRAPVPGLAARVLEQITSHPESLNMRSWHSDCGTKHCFAGWAVTLAGEAGKAAEGRLETAPAARLLLGGSDHPFDEEDGGRVIPWLEARVAEEESDARLERT